MGERRRILDIGDRHLKLFRQIRDQLDDLRESTLDIAAECLEFGRFLDHVGHLGDPGDKVGLLGDVRTQPDPLTPLDEHPDRSVRHLEHARDHADHPHVVELVWRRCVLFRIGRCDHHEHPVPG